ncbi:hypothetical protein JV173_00130 [Acholeplasma equirhinis]|uniref:hypothetical protein n=1 Tax=Acholeplasma equirhinis TaxID=555393 RepID=UPI00197A9EC1|nr:hypothetical protein [Acholeplasma equirhinis]MBN3489909.1 hypothetical protein [Acholeplasma equirhinis]
MKTPSNKGMILGITAVTMLVVSLLVIVVFSIIMSKYAFYETRNQEIENKLKLQTYAQEVYVELYQDILIPDVQVTYYVEALDQNINIEINDGYLYEIVFEGFKIEVKVSTTGVVEEWIMTPWEF